jgi:threonine/homoserine/homoserine lactone efflux protein
MLEFIAATLILSILFLLTIAYQMFSLSLIAFGIRLMRGKVADATKRIDRLMGCAMFLSGVWMMTIQFTAFIG